MLDIHSDPKPLKLTYFWLGLIATFAYRMIIVLNFFNPLWVQIAWYVGTIGFIFYFWSRYKVVKQFTRLIREQELEKSLTQVTNITEDQRSAMSHIIQSLATTKAQINYEVIFVLSILALIAGIVLDIFG
jgi:hypothetical protein